MANAASAESFLAERSAASFVVAHKQLLARAQLALVQQLDDDLRNHRLAGAVYLQACVSAHWCPVDDRHSKKRPSGLFARASRLILQCSLPSSVSRLRLFDNAESIGFPLEIFRWLEER
jgi:hypothetical protein